MHPFPERHSQFLLLRAWTSWTWRSVVGPLFDSAYDWNHYGGPVFDVVGKRLLSIILQHILHHGQKQPAAVPSPPQPAPSLLSNALPVQQQSYAPPQQQAGGVVAAPPMQEERRPWKQQATTTPNTSVTKKQHKDQLCMLIYQMTSGCFSRH